MHEDQRARFRRIDHAVVTVADDRAQPIVRRGGRPAGSPRSSHRSGPQVREVIDEGLELVRRNVDPVKGRVFVGGLIHQRLSGITQRQYTAPRYFLVPFVPRHIRQREIGRQPAHVFGRVAQIERLLPTRSTRRRSRPRRPARSTPRAVRNRSTRWHRRATAADKTRCRETANL